MFRLMKIRPPSGWPAVWWELAIVTLGVLIALGAQQAVDAGQWREKVAVVRQSMIAELANNRARWEWNHGDAACVLRDINTLDRWAATAPLASAPPATVLVGHSTGKVSLYWMHSAVWDIATSSQALDHFPLQEQLRFATMYEGIAHRQVSLEKESDMRDGLVKLISLTDTEQGRRQLRLALGDLSAKVQARLTNNAYMVQHFDQLGVRSDSGDLAAAPPGSACSS